MTCQFIVTLNGVDLSYPSRALAEEFKASFEENLWNAVSEVEFRPADQPIIVTVPAETIIHTDANGYTCGQPDCPCSAEMEDEIILTPPSEEQLEVQEQSVLAALQPAERFPSWQNLEQTSVSRSKTGRRSSRLTWLIE